MNIHKNARLTPLSRARWCVALWAKAVQLDLEAKGPLVRGPGNPVRLWRSG